MFSFTGVWSLYLLYRVYQLNILKSQTKQTMNAGVHPLVIIIVLCLSVTNGSCRVIYVTPEKEHSCPHNTQLCYTLSHIAENPMNYFSSNTRIIFLPGNHTTDTNRSIVIANVSDITLEGSGSTIQCIKGRELGFVFIQVTNLSITNLHLYQCGAVLPLEVEPKITTLSKLLNYNKEIYTKCSPALYLIQVTNITVSKVSIYNSTGPGLLGFNVFGHSTISQSSFIRNNPNCVVLFMDTNTLFQSVLLSIFDSKLLFGKFQHVGTKTTSACHSIAAGLSVIIAQTSYMLQINISNVTAHANNGIDCGNLYFYIMSCNTKIHLHKINSSHSNYTGLALQIESSIPRSKRCWVHPMIISQSLFGHNTHAVDITGKEFIDSEWYTSERTGVVTLVNTTFHTNSLALRLNSFHAILNGISFTHNIVETDGSAPVQILDSSVTFKGNTIFLRNRGETAGAICANASELILEGNLKFVENEGYDGGAIAFYQLSQITLRYSMFKITFTRNHARHCGGAIYINQIKSTLQLHCFYSLDGGLVVNITGLMVFNNNTSGIAGSAIYGGWIKLCYTLSYYRPRVEFLYASEKVLKLIQSVQISHQCPLNQFVFAYVLTQSLNATSPIILSKPTLERHFKSLQ